MNKRENIYSLSGFTKVFKFTLLQTFKNPAYRASLIIFVLVMSLVGPLQSIITKNSMKSAEEALDINLVDSDIKAVTIVNTSEISLNEGDIKDAILWLIGNIPLSFTDDTKATLNSLKEDSVAIIISNTDAGYSVKGVVSDDTLVKPSDLDSLTGFVHERFEQARMAQSPLSSAMVERINAGITDGNVFTYEDYKAEKNKTIGGNQYIGYVMGYCIIAMLLISISNSYIMTSVTEEKTSKLVETLLVSVRPMALLMGKILGMMSYALSILVLGFLGSKISNLVMAAIFGSEITSVSASSLNFDMFTKFGVTGFLIMLLEIGISYFSFAILSGLFGSACVKQEDIPNATGTVMMITMVGYIGAIMGGIPDNTVINHLMSLLPPFSYYCLPIMYLCGRINLLVLIASFLIQGLLIASLTMLSARTYRNLILSDSSTPKLSAIFKSAKA
ncbi:MAG: ABC transporter permease [Lachnospiraceae bacterium]|nr:ABC transporter permease [Lachnospiraceae bacterium]